MTQTDGRILVAYSTAAGSTAEVAEAIGDAIEGIEVDVRRARQVKDVSPYKAVILGSGIRAGRVYREALNFLERHQAALRQMPVAYFVVCLTMMEDTEENRCEVEAYVDQMRQAAPQVEPVEVGLFGGKMDFKELSLPIRLIIKAMKTPEGDFRDWDAIRAWAKELKPKLTTT
ncbi:MAG: flavodoxin domain-containing protein [Anaerolineae bacterium]